MNLLSNTPLSHPFVQASLGGLLIGLASWLLLASLGRVAGISGIAAGALSPATGAPAEETAWRWAFLLGLIGMGAVTASYMHGPVIAARPYTLLVIAGLLVGFGTVLGSGCTSGHGVCGIGRRSARSLVATLVFMGAGVATVLIASLITNTPAGV
ncbi:MAG: YeeE/YedE thiosulfate transporter family protein [Burkholderiaceae bacterium]